MEFLNLKHSHIIYRETVIDTATLTSCSQQLSHFIIIAIFRFPFCTHVHMWSCCNAIDDDDEDADPDANRLSTKCVNL